MTARMAASLSGTPRKAAERWQRLVRVMDEIRVETPMVECRCG